MEQKCHLLRLVDLTHLLELDLSLFIMLQAYSNICRVFYNYQVPHYCFC